MAPRHLETSWLNELTKIIYLCVYTGVYRNKNESKPYVVQFDYDFKKRKKMQNMPFDIRKSGH